MTCPNQFDDHLTPSPADRQYHGATSNKNNKKMTLAHNRLGLMTSALCLLFLLPLALHANESIDAYISDQDIARLSQAGAEQTSIQLSVDGRDYTLSLSASTAIPATLAAHRQFFQGRVSGDDNSWARISLDGDALSGHLYAWGELLAVSWQGNTDSRNRFSLKPLSEKALTRYSGYDKVLVAPVKPIRRDRTFTAARALTDASTVNRVLQLAIVVDSRFDDIYQGKGLSKAYDIVNALDGLYQAQFGLAVQLTASRRLTNDNDPFLHLDGNIETVLREFRHYVRADAEFSANKGVMHLFSGAQDDTNIIGLSWINTLCRTDGYNVSVSTPFAQQMLLAAHEIGHNLGAVHDDSAQCDVEHDKVMWPKISSDTQSAFSSCSKAAVLPNLNAACNLDNIDVAVTMTQENAQEIQITARNLSTHRTAHGLASQTQLAEGVTLTRLPSSCATSDNLVTCQHTDLAPGASDNVILHLSTENKTTITTKLTFTAFADINALNNQASLDTSAPVSTPAEPEGEPTPTEPSAGETSASGGGALSWTGLLLLMAHIARQAVPVSRRYAPEYR